MFFGLFASVEKKARVTAAGWLELAEKVYHYRRDVLSESDRQELLQRRETLRQELQAKAEPGKLQLAMDALEPVLRRVGGSHYPKSTLVEYVEFFLVASIVIIGIRLFFVQPFKIPTNSMWPSYYGMTGEVFANREAEPNVIERAFRLVTLGARPRTLNAPADGEVLIPVGNVDGRGLVRYTAGKGRTWLILPSKIRQYRFLVGDRWTETKVPIDFDFDWVVRDAFFPGNRSLNDVLREKIQHHEFEDRIVNDGFGGSERIRFIKTGKFVKTDERVLSFDILTGDQLFVDRFSYHFFRPKVGDGFVFRTGGIPQLSASYGDQYYIKRLVGVPGDTLEIRRPVLYRNGEPITGSTAFDKNARKEDRYSGYYNEGILAAGQTFTVPANRYLPLGDNSGNSLDGRYWGTVPAADVVGRPLVIYYPFTKRSGLAP